MDSKKTTNSKKKKKMALNGLISLIVIYDDHEQLNPSLDRIAEMDCPVYACSIDNESDTDIHPLRYIRDEQGKWTVSGTAQIGTPWMLFIEQDEFITKDQQKGLLKYLEMNGPRCAEIIVERFLTVDDVKIFEWVTTRDVYENPSEDIRRFHTFELRLLPTSLFESMSIKNAASSSDQPRFSININVPEQEILRLKTLVSRVDMERPKEDTERPGDRDIFLHGHQKYFDDRNYCERFQWPSSSYQTIRHFNIPPIIEGLRQGLSSYLIIHFTLIYLIRYRNFKEAFEIVKLMPDYWGERFPALLSSVGTIYFVLGDYENSLRTFKKAFELDQNPLVISNLIKILVVTENHDALKDIEREYEEITGNTLQDDFLDYFRQIHLENPGRSPSISLCMVVKDEEDHLERALSSVGEMVDEIIVVDTGSSDYSNDITEQLGAKVYEYQWSDDFSAARNYAIEQATCDYILMLDGDEYISPFHIIELQILKKILPLKNPNAYKLSIGYHFNESDWLFLVSELGNFREDTTSVRIFPRLPGIRYTGRIEESIEASLEQENIPINLLPASTIYILHDRQNRWNRISRKCHIYDKVEDPNEAVILSAIKDFVFLDESEEVIRWLKKLYESPMDDGQWKVRMGLQLAKSLEASTPAQAENLYREMLDLAPHNMSVTMAYANFLISNNKLSELAHVPFFMDQDWLETERAKELEYMCYASLKHFESEDTAKAFDLLESVLQETPSNLLAQSIRFYFLLHMREVEGSVFALNDLYKLMGVQRNDTIDTMEDLLRLVEELSSHLFDKGCHREGSLILQAVLSLGEIMVVR